MMKASALHYGVVLFLACSSAQAAVKLMDSEVYIQKIAKRVVEILESRYITGPDLPIDDYTAPIEMSSYGIELKGNVSFHSGFVVKIGGMELNMQRFRQFHNDTEVQIDANMLWRNIGIALEFNANLEGYQGSGTLLVTYGQFDLPLTTKRVFATGKITGTMKFMSISNQNDIIIVGHPNHPHVQMIARAINTNTPFRAYMLKSFERWNFQNILNIALSEVPYPQMCYNC